jgi:hypothetical protein
VNESLKHDADGCEGDHGFGDFWQFLIVFGQATPSAEPAECSFNDPSARDHDEAGGAGDAADDDQRQAEQKAGEPDRQPVVDAVGEDDLEPAVEVLDLLQQIPGAVGVLDIGGMDENTEQKAGGIDPDMALAALDLLGGIVAARPPFSVVLTLWVSMMAAVGLASRPSLSRSIMTR